MNKTGVRRKMFITVGKMRQDDFTALQPLFKPFPLGKNSFMNMGSAVIVKEG
jgi:hypothetical protein